MEFLLISSLVLRSKNGKNTVFSRRIAIKKINLLIYHKAVHITQQAEPKTCYGTVVLMDQRSNGYHVHSKSER